MIVTWICILNPPYVIIFCSSFLYFFEIVFLRFLGMDVSRMVDSSISVSFEADDESGSDTVGGSGSGNGDSGFAVDFSKLR